MTRKYTGVILAAGRGKRMAPFSERYPKPVLPICNRPLIEHQIEVMKSVGIRDIVVLIGYKGFEIAKLLGDGSRLGVRLRYVEQTTNLGIANAVGGLEMHIDEPFVLFLGDIFFVAGNLRCVFDLFEEQGGGAVVVAKEEAELEAVRRNFSIALGPDGLVTRVVEKPRYPSSRLKGVGLYLFDLTIFDAIRRTPRTAMRDEYEITDSIQVLIDDGHPVRPANAILDDINLTTPADLLRCNLMRAGHAPPGALIGANTRLNSQARTENCVIGTNVTIEHPIRIAHSLIFDNTYVDSVTGFEHCIVSPEFIVDCRQELRGRATGGGWLRGGDVEDPVAGYWG